MMQNTIVACPPVRIRLRQLPLDLSGIEQRGAAGDRVASRLIELKKEHRGAEGDRVASRLIDTEKSNEEPEATELRAEPK